MRYLNIIFSNTTGGESNVFRAISDHYGTKDLVIYDVHSGSFTDSLGFLSRKFFGMLLRINRDGGLFIASLFSAKFLKKSMLESYDVIFFHTSSLLIPKMNNAIPIIYTPPRAFTDRYEEVGEIVRKINPLYLPFFSLFRRIFNALYRKSLENSKIILCISETVSERLRRYYGSGGIVVHLFVNIEEFSPGEFQKYFLCVSRITPSKRQHAAIEAFKKFFEKNREFRMVIAGTPDNNDHSRKYFDKLREMSSGYPVEFVDSPSWERIRELYSNCYLTLFTAENEDFGLVPLESMASSKPVIAFDEGGPRETVVNGISGFLVKSVDEMASKMLFLAERPEVAVEMGLKGREIVEKKFSPSSFFSEIDSILESVSSGRKSY